MLSFMFHNSSLIMLFLSVMTPLRQNYCGCSTATAAATIVLIALQQMTALNSCIRMNTSTSGCTEAGPLVPSTVQVLRWQDE